MEFYFVYNCYDKSFNICKHKCINIIIIYKCINICIYKRFYICYHNCIGFSFINICYYKCLYICNNKCINIYFIYKRINNCDNINHVNQIGKQKMNKFGESKAPYQGSFLVSKYLKLSVCYQIYTYASS